jgi:hypothetical protein
MNATATLSKDSERFLELFETHRAGETKFELTPDLVASAIDKLDLGPNDFWTLADELERAGHFRMEKSGDQTFVHFTPAVPAGPTAPDESAAVPEPEAPPTPPTSGTEAAPVRRRRRGRKTGKKRGRTRRLQAEVGQTVGDLMARIDGEIEKVDGKITPLQQRKDRLLAQKQMLQDMLDGK